MSKIEWTEKTWNPITGCTKISAGCANCYAERMSHRLAGRFGYPADDPFRVTFHPDKLEEPLHWKTPRRVFVCSMGDLFHEKVSDEWLAEIWSVMLRCPQHTFQILTKRPAACRWWIDLHYGRFDVRCIEPPQNIWLGVTAENQTEADKRIPILLDIPAAVRFVSIEPMLGGIDISPYLPCEVDSGGYDPQGHSINVWMPGIDWVIVGGETGPGARPMHPDWARSVRDQCQEAGVPFFFKGWGVAIYWEHTNKTEEAYTFPIWKSTNNQERVHNPWDLFGGWQYDNCHRIKPELYSEHIGKKRAGRLLDGQLWEQYP